MIPILYEDDHLLVINKPAGLNTHSPSPFAGEGIYEWLKNREPRWAELAILHRLDKETSGTIVFGKTTLANRSLTEQFATRTVLKKYLLATDRRVAFTHFTAESSLVRSGEKYLSRPVHVGGENAQTHFKKIKEDGSGRTFVEAEPVTGRTHQIRVHAASHGFPILGDTIYGGTNAPRLFLHAAELSVLHPVTGERMVFSAPHKFLDDSRLALRTDLIESDVTDAFRLIHGASDFQPGWFVDRLGDFLLSQSDAEVTQMQRAQLEKIAAKFSLHGVYHKILNRQIQRTNANVSPQLVSGEVASDFLVRENGIQFSLSFIEGYSVGLFLDQRENRRRLLTNYIAPKFFLPAKLEERQEVLNTFAYTCAFSLCAAKNGAKVTSLDLSKKYLEWGKRNFILNGLDPDAHEFIYGDAFDWMKRLTKRERCFDLIILDPPTFSHSKEQGKFQAEKDYGNLIASALPLLKKEGVLLASTNAANLKPELFLEIVHASVARAKRKIIQQHYAPQPIDFPVSREEPAYLKTVWLKIA